MLDKLLTLRIDPEKMLHAGGRVATIGGGGTRIFARGGEQWAVTVGHPSKRFIEKVAGHFRPQQIIRSYYEWDYNLSGFLTDEGTIKEIQKLKEYGLRAVVQADLSVWYEEREERRLFHMYRNFRHMELAQEAGLLVALNFNNIMSKYLWVYERILPKDLGTVFIDANHKEDAFLRHELHAFSWLLDNYAVDGLVIRTGRRKLVDKRLEKIVNLAVMRGIPMSFFPSEFFFMSAASKEREKRGRQLIRIPPPKVTVSVGGRDGT